MKKSWAQFSNNFELTEVSNNHDILPVSIYKTQINPRTMQIYLEQTQDKFTFPYKIYGIEKDFIDHVVKTYHNTSGNLGVLLNGVKGTGKTVTAQMLCNALHLPVIIVQDKYDNLLPNFINNIQQDVIIFFDEYEKMYNNYDHSILTVMDGVLNNEFRKTYLLTTNTSYVNENMLSRPSRIRYFKTFGDLALKDILEIVDDKLERKEFKNEIIDFVSNLEIITVDIVKSIVEEVNIHNMPPEKFKHIFNIKSSAGLFNVFSIVDGVSKLYKENVVIHPRLLRDEYSNIPDSSFVDSELLINNDYVGDIIAILDEKVIVKRLRMDDEGNTSTPDNDEDKTLVLTFENVKSRHKIFKSYVF